MAIQHRRYKSNHEASISDSGKLSIRQIRPDRVYKVLTPINHCLLASMPRLYDDYDRWNSSTSSEWDVEQIPENSYIYIVEVSDRTFDFIPLESNMHLNIRLAKYETSLINNLDIAFELVDTRLKENRLKFKPILDKLKQLQLIRSYTI